jgi:uncharacterized BrkB/YihY/UPF0761 family membrane protein
MRFLDIVFHLANFIAPALFLAAGMVLCERWVLRRRNIAMSWKRRVALYAAAGCAVLLLGLVLLGRDGKMLTYGALALTLALLSFTLQKAWQK